MCAAACYLHKHDIIHRDLKKENLLFTENGDAKVCDLGFARELNYQQMTRLGTPAYIAPEVYNVELALQEKKNIARYDERADVWSIGVLAFSLVTGKFPFNGSPQQI